MKPYTIYDFHNDFPDERACLEWLKNQRYPDGIHCRNCNEITNHYRITGQKSYCCQNCGNNVFPTSGTIFHKSSTLLKNWLYVAFLIIQSDGQISAKDIQREINVTYKTAWRMRKLIREQLEAQS
ncbi:MAG: transposase [Aggregatilineales bacterium]